MDLKVNIGIPEPERQAIAGGLKRLLADTYSLYLKTHAFHWNVTGPHFSTLHNLFEEQYRELWGATDTIAERIRALDAFAPSGGSEFARLTEVPESSGVPSATEMMRELLLGHETVARTARGLYPVSEKGADEGTMDLLTERLQTHEKAAWMLRSMLKT